MNYCGLTAGVASALWVATGLAEASECKSAVVDECRAELRSGGWRAQFLKPADPQMMDASTEYDVWTRGGDALLCVRNYWRGNMQGSMNCMPLQRVAQ